jgi:hypothetical protein
MTKGPIPKRSEERVRRNKTGEDGLELEVITLPGKVEVPELNLGHVAHPLVVSLWESLPESGQTKWWEPSDWQYARIVMYAIDELVQTGMTAMKLAAVDAMMSKLLLTEADRRRVKIEIKRTEADASVVNAEKYFKAAFEQQAKNNRKTS